MKKNKWLFLFLFVCSLLQGAEEEKPYIVGELYGQLGNNLFQVAAASAVAWDNNATPYFPGLCLVPKLYQHIFSRCQSEPPQRPVAFHWQEPGIPYTQVPFHKDMKMSGYFQSEKYFAHHRKRLVELFQPITKDLKYIEKKYSAIVNHPRTVGIQLRHYFEDQNGKIYIQYGKDYLEKAMALFQEPVLFIVSSNNVAFARQNVPAGKNVLFLENEPHYIDFYLLSMCKHIIITNSTFGWWAAWLNQSPNKIVVCPKKWLNGGYPDDGICPTSWISLDAKKGCYKDPMSY